MTSYEDEHSQVPAEAKDREVGVDIPHELLEPSTLEELIKSFVLREGTDYGAQEASLERKIEDIRRQLKQKKLKIVFDFTTESSSIVPADRS